MKYILLLLLLMALLIIPSKMTTAVNNIEPESVVEVIEVLSPKQMIEREFAKEPVMIRIADAESDFCTNNVNPESSARGCFQILKGTWKAYGCIGDVMNVNDNIRCARIIFDRDGTVPWNASKHVWQ